MGWLRGLLPERPRVEQFSPLQHLVVLFIPGVGDRGEVVTGV